MTGVPPYFAQLEQQYGLPPGYLYRTAMVESHLDPSATHGSMRGAFQFSPDTAKSVGLQNPMDLQASAAAAAKLAAQNAQAIHWNPQTDPTGAQLYLAHQQGAGGAGALLSSPNTPAGQLTKPSFIAANGGDPTLPASAFVNHWAQNFGQVQVPGVLGGGVSGSPGGQNVVASGTGQPPVQDTGTAAPPVPAAQPAQPTQATPMQMAQGFMGQQQAQQQKSQQAMSELEQEAARYRQSNINRPRGLLG